MSALTDLPPPDMVDVRELMMGHSRVMVAFYRSRAADRGNVVSQLAALAAMARLVIAGTDDDDRAIAFFRAELDRVLDEAPEALEARLSDG